MNIGTMGRRLRTERSFLDILNSDWPDWREAPRKEDRLKNREWVRGFLARWGLDYAGVLDAEVVATLRDLRSLMRRIVQRLSRGADPSAEDLSLLNQVLAAAPSVHRLVRSGSQYQMEEAPLEKNWNWVRAEIARGLADMIAHGDPARFRICENPECLWVFYDESRNRARRWCDERCGNLSRVRRFREKQRATEG
ncbi:MAG: CGNR zinc finger domain-containing protein [Bacillota bacterium]